MTTETTPTTQTETNSIAGAVLAGGKGAEGKVESTPSQGDAPQTFNKEDWDKRESEWNKRYSGLDSKLSKTTEQYNKLQQELEELRNAKSLAEEQALLKTAELNGEDINVVKTTLEKRRATEARERELAQWEERLKSQEAALIEAARVRKAQEYAAQFNLADSELDDLLKSETPEQMENKALRLALQKQQTASIKPTKLDSNQRVSGASTVEYSPRVLGQLVKDTLKK